LKGILTKHDFWLAVLFIIFCVFYFGISSSMDEQIVAYPKIILTFLLLLSILLLFRSHKSMNNQEEISKEKAKKTISILLIIIGYLFIMNFLGFIVSSGIFIFTLMTFVKSRWHWGWRLVASFATVGIVYLLFAKVFYVPLP